MTHASYNSALYEEEARVAAIYPVGMIGDPESAPDWLEELYESCIDADDPLFQALPELKADADAASEWAEALVLRSRTGFVVKWEVCVRHYLGAGKMGFRSGWGHVRFGVFYTETIEEIGPAVLKIARDQHEAERRKAGEA